MHPCAQLGFSGAYYVIDGVANSARLSCLSLSPFGFELTQDQSLTVAFFLHSGFTTGGSPIETYSWKSPS